MGWEVPRSLHQRAGKWQKPLSQQEHKALCMMSRSGCPSGCDLFPQFKSHHWFIDPASPSLPRRTEVCLKEAISVVRQVFPKSHTYS